MHKIVKIILVVLSAIGVVLWFMLPEAEVPPAEAAQSASLNWMLIVTYLLLAIAIAISLFYSLKNLFSTPASIKKALFALGGLALVVIISYVLSSGTDVNLDEMARKGVPTTEGTVKIIGAGLNVFFILTLAAVVLLVLPGVKKVFTK